MAPSLRVSAGPSIQELTDISHSVNTGNPHSISSDAFHGRVAVNIKGFNGNIGDYFAREDRVGVTWSIQVQGRFLQDRSADDVLFGNTFDRPLQLPWGTTPALKFMSYMDPTLEHDLTSTTKPWALSPLIATMPYFAHTRLPEPEAPNGVDIDDVDDEPAPAPTTPPLPPFPQDHSITDDTTHLHLCNTNTSPNHQLNLPTPSSRRAHFASQQHRGEITFTPADVLTTDFCYGFIEFSPNLTLRIPGGLSFDLERYWDGQPVRFVCCERKKKKEDNGEGEEVPWGRVFWCIVIEMVEQ